MGKKRKDRDVPAVGEGPRDSVPDAPGTEQKRKGRGNGEGVAKTAKVSQNGTGRSAVKDGTVNGNIAGGREKRATFRPIVGRKVTKESTGEKVAGEETDGGGEGAAAIGSKKDDGASAAASGGGEGGKGVKNKEKVLILSSRGIVFRYRHLMEDLICLLPHSKKDSKLEQGKDDSLGTALNELADLKGCSSCIYFEMRKRKDLYMWLSKVPNGPSVKFYVNSVHTMSELKLVGNHLKGSRPILTFSPSFDSLPHLQLLKELFTQLFTTPKGHRKSKPFFDHVQSFTFLDNHVWFRNYQVVLPGSEAAEGGKLEKSMLDKMTLVEVGPRFCLSPMRIFGGSFGGSTLFENPHFVPPNVVRSAEKADESKRYRVKLKAKQRRKQHELAHRLDPDALAGVWKE